MLVNLIKIGDSQGIKIPESILKECNINNNIELEIKNHTIFLKSVKPRSNWDKQFIKMNASDDKKILIDDKIDLEIEGENWEW